MPKKEYIEREAIEKAFAKEIHTNYLDDYAKGFQAALLAVMSIPAADPEAAPVRHGYWIKENFYARCSVCENMAIYDKYGQEVESDYCPNCGAKMDGDKNV